MDLASPPLETSKAQLESIFLAHQSALAAAPAPDCALRSTHLKVLQRLLCENVSVIAAAISKDFGHRSAHETQLLELFPALQAIKHALKHIKTWMKPQRAWAALWFIPARTELRSQPLGVVGIIAPWNYPILLAVGPLVSALAAGNRVMLKMSEFTPHTAELFAQLIARYFPSGPISVINGGPETGKAFTALPFDHLLFTGATQVGRQVMRAAAENLTPLTLELGGKSPAIVGTDFPIALAAQRILFGKCLNAGQTCIAPDYVLLPRGCEDEFIAAAKAAVAQLYPTLKDNADYTAIVNLRHKQRLASYLEDARDQGAVVVELNPANEIFSSSNKLPPTIVTQVNDTMRLMQEEIFGPLLPVLSYQSLDEAIGYVKRHARPLALYYFGYEPSAIERVLNETISGGVSINETIMHIAQDHLPFGGVGASGMGHYHGRFGFETFSKLKPVFRQSRYNGLKLFHPPFGKRFAALIKMMLR